METELIVSMARLHAAKGLDTLIRAFARLSSSELGPHLAIVGWDDGMLRMLRTQVAPLNLKSRVSFCGPLYGKERIEAYVDADIFSLTPRFFEETSLAALEAAALRARPEPRLSECDFGRWAGSTLAEVHAADPDAARSWMLDPDAAPHDGEPLTAFTERVAEWLDDQAQRPGTITAITHAGVVKAAVVYALGAPMSAFWQIDAAPLSLTEMHAHDGCWTVTRVNCLLGGGAP